MISLEETIVFGDVRSNVHLCFLELETSKPQRHIKSVPIDKLKTSKNQGKWVLLGACRENQGSKHDVLCIQKNCATVPCVCHLAMSFFTEMMTWFRVWV